MAQQSPPWRAIAGGFAVAVGIVLLLVYVVGVGEVLAVLAGTDLLVTLALVATALVWIVAWSYTLYLVLRSLGIALSPSRSVVVFAGMLFTDSVLPFSVAGSQPFAAALVARGTAASYQRSFAAAASVGVLNFLPAPGFALVGSLYLGATALLGGGYLLVSLVGILGVLTLGGVAGWRYRWRVVGTTASILAWLLDRLSRVLPFRSPGREAVADSIATVVEAIERVASDRRTIGLSVGAGALGWALLSAMLWLSFVALGHRVSFEATLFIVPLATVADVVPVPGGIGSIDAALVLLLVATTGTPAAVATAAVILYRGASYLLPVVLGGAAVFVVHTY